MPEADFSIRPGITVWMNVSTSANWNRPPVGIVRVEQEVQRQLSERFGAQFKTCVLENGQFVEAGGVGRGRPSLEPDVDPDAFYWPDPSFNFPALEALEGPRVRPLKQATSRRGPAEPRGKVTPRVGDVFVSIGLDWDWESQRLDLLLHEFKEHMGVTVITCCYDLIPVLFPHYCVGEVAAKFKEYFTNLTYASSGILCISKQSEKDYRDLADTIGLPHVPTKVIALGSDLPESDTTEYSREVQDVLDGKFILFVSTIERRKNHEVIYRAVRLLAEQGELPSDLKVVFVGMPGWGVGDLLKDIELDPLTRKTFVQLHHVSDSELRALYEGCRFFVYPSLYEGWGLPVAEALSAGKLVLASDRGSIPEVGGDLVEYLDPWAPREWASAIKRYFSDDQALNAAEARIASDFVPYSWKRTGEQVGEFLAELSANPPSSYAIVPGYEMQSRDGLVYGPRIIADGKAGLIAFGSYRGVPEGAITITLGITSAGNEPGMLKLKVGANRSQIMLAEREIELTGQDDFGPEAFEFDLILKRAVGDLELVLTTEEPHTFALEYATIEMRDSKK